MQNKTILQSFEWYTTEDGSFYRMMKDNAPSFSLLGLTSVWLPPACKAQNGVHDTGYGIYDLYDLGEFDQKGSVRTKYGTKDEYLEAVRALQNQGIQVLADIVLNHRMGADGTETVMAEECLNTDRNKDIGEERQITAWTRFDFPGRAGKRADPC